MLELCIGFTGMAMILIAFFMNESHRWSTDALVYDSFNAIGALLLVVYALAIHSWPFLFLNSIWVIVSARDIATRLGKGVKTRSVAYKKKK